MPEKSWQTKWQSIPQRHFSAEQRPPECLPSFFLIFFFVASLPTVRMRFFFRRKKGKTRLEAQRSCVLCFTRDADTREKLCFHTAELQPLVSVSWGLWSLQKAKRPEKNRKMGKKEKTWPGFKNNKSGISISAFKWRKTLTGEFLEERDGGDALHRLHAAENTTVSLACALCLIVRQGARLRIHRALFPFPFLLSSESSEGEAASWNFGWMDVFTPREPAA